VKNSFMKLFASSLWGKYRSLPTFSAQSFRKQWKRK